MDYKIVENKFIIAFVFIFCLVVWGLELNAQEMRSDSISSTYKEPALIYEMAYKPFNYFVTLWDPDFSGLLNINMIADIDEEVFLIKPNLLKSFSLNGSVAIRLKPRHYIKTGLAYSHTLLYYNTGGYTFDLPKYDEFFFTDVYSYVNSLKFEHIQIPLLWSYQSFSELTRFTFSLDAGFLFSTTTNYTSKSSLYWRKKGETSRDYIKTDILAYQIIIDSKDGEFRNIRYNSKGEVKTIKNNDGSKVARRFIIGGFTEMNMHYNITSFLRVGAGLWANVDFSSMEKRGREGELLPLVSASFDPGDNIIPYYSLQYGLALSIGYMW